MADTTVISSGIIDFLKDKPDLLEALSGEPKLYMWKNLWRREILIYGKTKLLIITWFFFFVQIFQPQRGVQSLLALKSWS